MRLAQTAAEVRQRAASCATACSTRRAAIADATAGFAQRDVDAFDAICDHLLVIDHDRRRNGPRAAVVGTYRLLRQDVAERHGGFYSAGEFDIGELIARHPDLRFLELGRSCVLAPYRNKRTVELLWHGIAALHRCSTAAT